MTEIKIFGVSMGCCFHCSFDKIVIVTSFTVVLVIFMILVTDDDDDYWIINKMEHFTLDLMENSSDAETLSSEIRILCLVMTHPANHKTKALKVFRTWGRRCTFIKFLTTQEDEELPTLLSPTKEEYGQIWGKTKYGFQQAYEQYYELVDWVVKADDDTYLILENLRYMLSEYNSSQPIWFGCEFKVIVRDGYMSGGAGYVLSRGRIKSIKIDF